LCKHLFACKWRDHLGRNTGDEVHTLLDFLQKSLRRQQKRLFSSAWALRKQSSGLFLAKAAQRTFWVCEHRTPENCCLQRGAVDLCKKSIGKIVAADCFYP
jgi:hypothetical protein